MTKKRFAALIFSCIFPLLSVAQVDIPGNAEESNGQRNHFGPNSNKGQNNKEIPVGISVWRIDERFGDKYEATPDTLSPMFMNTIFTTGLHGEYNTTGNLGAPRINRIFIERPEDSQFIFTAPYDFFIKSPAQLHFTNTLSPFTNLTYNTCGDRMNGEDHLKAMFGVNINRKLGFGFNFDYIYGRGYYDSQSTSHFNYTAHGSYIGERYAAHLLMSTNHQKVAENGGITDDNYIVHPESFTDSYTTSEIPTVLQRNWNRNDNQHLLFSHRYNIGFRRKVPMTDAEIDAKKFAIESQKEQQEREKQIKQEKEARDSGRKRPADSTTEQTFAGRPDDAKIAGYEPTQTTAKQTDGRVTISSKEIADSLAAAKNSDSESSEWTKYEYVPVTSIIHTLKADNYKRIFEAYETPTDFYAHTYENIGKLQSDSIYDRTRHYQIKNTLAISMLDGFNKWAKAGIKLFATSDLRHFTLPDTFNTHSTYNEHTLSIGGQISKHQGNALHYSATAETWIAGEDAGQVKLNATADVNFRLFGDTVTLAANGFLHHRNPSFYYRHYHSKHLWWDNNDLQKIIHSRIEGRFRYKKTRTELRIAADEIKNLTYFAQSYRITDNFGRAANTVNVRQATDPITLFTAALSQDFTLGPLNWESIVTYQKSSDSNSLPVPDINIYTNLFLRFKIARVLSVDLGADARYFTSYYAPDYSPALGQFTVQEKAVSDGDIDYRTKTGNCPIVNVYANCHLKHTRFFIMMSHVNASIGKQNYFFTPHYPLNQRLIRFGLSWNFFN